MVRISRVSSVILTLGSLAFACAVGEIDLQDTETAVPLHALPFSANQISEPLDSGHRLKCDPPFLAAQDGAVPRSLVHTEIIPQVAAERVQSSATGHRSRLATPIVRGAASTRVSAVASDTEPLEDTIEVPLPRMAVTPQQIIATRPGEPGTDDECQVIYDDFKANSVTEPTEEAPGALNSVAMCLVVREQDSDILEVSELTTYLHLHVSAILMCMSSLSSTLCRSSS